MTELLFAFLMLFIPALCLCKAAGKETPLPGEPLPQASVSADVAPPVLSEATASGRS